MLLAFSAHDIDSAGLAVDVALPPAWLEAELTDASLTAKAPGRITGRLSRSGNDIVVRAHVRASLTTPCARCLDPAPLDVDTELSLLLRPESPPPAPTKAKAKPGGPSATQTKPTQALRKAPLASKAEAKLVEYEFSSEEADHDTFDGETVVLDPFVREAILLEAPNFPLCSEACAGIRPAAAAPPVEAAGSHVDPRLAPLASITLGAAPAPAPKKKNKE
jgi:uncharacterized protein